MEPGFWDVIVYVVPALALVYFLLKRDSHDSGWVDHNLYKNYRKTRMDKPVL
ncbi:MAG: hypothetical protein JO301_14515 [Chitinophagaceae bacterium]|nr:hypothetical protein [Chitinophagaceae bacterium]